MSDTFELSKLPERLSSEISNKSNTEADLVDIRDARLGASDPQNLTPSADGIIIGTVDLTLNNNEDSVPESLDPPVPEFSAVSIANPSPDKELDSGHLDPNAISQDASNSRRKKSVGFAPEPEEDLKEHHDYLQNKRTQNLQSSPFWKVPPELAHLEKRSQGPKPLPMRPVDHHTRPKKAVKLDDIPDLPSRAVKEISTVNRYTALNFNYHEVVLPIGPDRILVEVRYVSVSSMDLGKIQRYKYNISNERIGLAYDFVGEIAYLGKNFVGSTEFQKGTKVFGVTNPAEKKGALQTCVIVNLSDVLIPITDEMFEQVAKRDLQLSFSAPDQFRIEEESITDPADVDESLRQEAPGSEHATPSHLKKPPARGYQVETSLDTLAKFSVFGSQYCRAKQSLLLMDRVFASQRTANILINGADTCLGFTLVQILASKLYRDMLDNLNVTMVIQDASRSMMQNFIDGLTHSQQFKFHLVTFDSANEDLILPGESVPLNYKKVPFFATEVLDCVLDIAAEPITKGNFRKAKLDLFIDIVGSRKMFQKNVSPSKFDEVNFPFKARLADGVKPSDILNKTKEPLFTKLMKPKSAGASFVSYCDYHMSEPLYLVETLMRVIKKLVDPWSLSWTLGLANTFVSGYYYYEKLDLQIKGAWVQEAFDLVASGELRFRIDEIVDWRDDFRTKFEKLRKVDRHLVFKIEPF